MFTREEARTLISTSKIPWERRIAYALDLLGGMRSGEPAALRWRRYHDDRPPLNQLVVALSHNSTHARGHEGNQDRCGQARA